MKILACFPERDYYFLGVSQQEIDESISFMRDALEKDRASSRFKNLWVSSKKTMQKEIEFQRKIKAQPYLSRTIKYGQSIGEAPIYDAYIIVSRSLNELYFVPFYAVLHNKHVNRSPWGPCPHDEISSLLELTDIPFRGRDGLPYGEEYDFSYEEHVRVVSKFNDIIDNIAKGGPKYAFDWIYKEFQAYKLSVADLDKYFSLCHICLPDLFALDWIHMHMHPEALNGIKEEKIETIKRSFEEEKEILDHALFNAKYSDNDVGEMLIMDFLDGIVDYETMCELFGYRMDDYEGKGEDYIRKCLWKEFANIQ